MTWSFWSNVQCVALLSQLNGKFSFYQCPHAHTYDRKPWQQQQRQHQGNKNKLKTGKLKWLIVAEELPILLQTVLLFSFFIILLFFRCCFSFYDCLELSKICDPSDCLCEHSSIKWMIKAEQQQQHFSDGFCLFFPCFWL